MRHLSKAIATIAIIIVTISARAYEWNGCDGPDFDSRIPLCTKLIEAPDIEPARLAGAFSRRGFSYLELGQYQRAIRDYDETIRILSPFSDKYALDNRAVAYNNRASAYIGLGKPSQALPDAQMALEIRPQVPHFSATRGEIRQRLGDQGGALRDQDAAMALGGARWVKYYQCGLRLAQVYHGPIDGIISLELRAALRMCVDKGSSCDAVSQDRECPEPVG